MDAWKARDEAERVIDGPVMSLAGSFDLGRLGVKLDFELPRRRGRRLGHLVTGDGGSRTSVESSRSSVSGAAFSGPAKCGASQLVVSEAAPRVELVIVRQMRPTQLSQLLRCNGALDHGVRSKS